MMISQTISFAICNNFKFTLNDIVILISWGGGDHLHKLEAAIINNRLKLALADHFQLADTGKRWHDTGL